MQLSKSLFGRFRADRRGNFGMMLALTTVPLLAAVGLAVDYTTLTASRSSLQNANDAAVLFAARYRQVNGKMPSNTMVKDFLSANFSGDLTSTVVKIVGTDIVIESAAKGQVFVFGMFSSYVPDVSVLSAAPITGDSVLEVALALDTTYSMTADDKIGGLKAAATKFVDAVFSSAGPSNKVSIGVVPFSNYVNVGLTNRNQPWMSVPADLTQVVPAYCAEQRDIISKSNCHVETYYSDGIPYESEVCDYVYGDPKEVCYPESTQTVKWWGCVGDRDSPYTLRDTKPDIPFPGMMDSWDMTTWACPTPIRPLTSSKSDVLASIDALTPAGETYIVDGVLWGERLLTPDAPFSEGVDPKKTTADVRKVLVLMSDGDNTMSSQLPDYYGHWGTDGAQSDNWTKTACSNARADGIEIYSITFGKAVSANGKDVMLKCATDATHYYDAANSAALAKAFSDIAGKLNRVRLTM